MSYKLIRDYWSAMTTNDWHGVARDFLSEEFMCLWPQSGEVIRGRDEFARVNAAFPGQGGWVFDVLRVTGDDALIVSDIRVTNAEMKALSRAITFHDVTGGRIVRQVEFWPDLYNVPGWRQGMLPIEPDVAQY